MKKILIIWTISFSISYFTSFLLLMIAGNVSAIVMSIAINTVMVFSMPHIAKLVNKN
jgi:hypothetical protein